jgi:hypothetical protein
MRSHSPRNSRNDGCGNLDYSGILSLLRVPDARASHRDSLRLCRRSASDGSAGEIISGPFPKLTKFVCFHSRVVSEIAPGARLLRYYCLLNHTWLRDQFDRHQSDSSAVLHCHIEWNRRAATARDDHADRQKSIDHEEEGQRTREQHLGLDHDDCHEHRGSGVVADAGCGEIKRMAVSNFEHRDEQN